MLAELAPCVFEMALEKMELISKRSLIGGISGLNYLQIYAISNDYWSKEMNFVRFWSCFFLFFIYSIIAVLNAKLLPITSGQRTFRLFEGSPNFQRVYSFVVLIFNPLDSPSFSRVSLVLGVLFQQQQIAYIPLTITFLTKGFLFL